MAKRKPYPCYRKQYKFIKVCDFKRKLTAALDALPARRWKECRESSGERNWKEYKTDQALKQNSIRFLTERLKDGLMNRPAQKLIVKLNEDLSAKNIQSRLMPVTLASVGDVVSTCNRKFHIDLDDERLERSELTCDQVWNAIRKRYKYARRLNRSEIKICPDKKDETLDTIKKCVVGGIEGLNRFENLGRGRLLLSGCRLEHSLDCDLIEHDQTQVAGFRDLVTTIAIPQLEDLIRKRDGILVKNAMPLVEYLGDRLTEIEKQLGHLMEC